MVYNMITIVTPSFNSKDFIKQQYHRLKPILSGTVKWLIIDDCSQDGTEELVKDFSSPYVTCYKLEVNSGPSRARYIGAEIASTEFVFFLDADDVLFNDSFQNLLNHIKLHMDNNIQYYYGPGYSANSIMTEPESLRIYKSLTIRKPTDFILFGMPNYSSLAVKRSFFITYIKQNDLMWGEDILSYLQLSNFGIGQRWIKPVSCYVITGDGRGSQLSLSKRFDLFKALIRASFYAPNRINSFIFSFFLIVRFLCSYGYKRLRG